MRILLLVDGFNSLSQRLYVELARDGHELSLELDIHERVTCEAVDLFQPHVILAAFLKRAIPASVWRRNICLIVHPGPRAIAVPRRSTGRSCAASLPGASPYCRPKRSSTLARSGPAYRFRCAPHAKAACIEMRSPRARSSPCARRSPA